MERNHYDQYDSGGRYYPGPPGPYYNAQPTGVPLPGMIMKLPATNGSGNGYYGHDMTTSGVISSYLPDGPDQDEVDSPTTPGDFSEYMWMENEEEFDKQVMQQLEEEALMEQCIEAMLEDEQEIRNLHNQAQSFPASAPNNCNGEASPAWNGQYATYELCQDMNSLGLKDDLARKSTLNPNAAEFVPGSSTVPAKDEHLPAATTSSNSDSKDSSQA